MRAYLMLLVAGLMVGGLVVVPSVSYAGPPDTATMHYGRPNLGSGCNFPCTDDASFHAVDKIKPGAVSITEGGTVNFDVEGFHQVTIYADGKTPKDVAVDAAAFPFVNDADLRLFLGTPTVDASFTFAKAGKYLVICNVAPHFAGAQMWGWVNVKEGATASGVAGGNQGELLFLPMISQ